MSEITSEADWHCAGCGAISRNRRRSCDCPTGVVIRGKDQAGKIDIVTTHVFPPIPDRQFDWLAYRDGDEESGPRGWGRTEQDAINDLRSLEDE